MAKLAKINPDGTLEFAPPYFLVDGRVVLDLCGKLAAEQGFLPMTETEGNVIFEADKAYEQNYMLSADGKMIESEWVEKKPPTEPPEDETARIYAELNLLQQTIINLQNEWEAIRPSLPISFKEGETINVK